MDSEQVDPVLLSRTGEQGFFLPFRDALSGNDWHGAGRYLDVDPAEDGRVNGDVNLAYNPYRAYDDTFPCPMPPPENWPRLPVRAGEAAYPR